MEYCNRPTFFAYSSSPPPPPSKKHFSLSSPHHNRPSFFRYKRYVGRWTGGGVFVLGNNLTVIMCTYTNYIVRFAMLPHPEEMRFPRGGKPKMDDGGMPETGSCAGAARCEGEEV